MTKVQPQNTAKVISRKNAARYFRR